MRSFVRMDLIVPFSMEFVTLDGYFTEFFTGDFASLHI